MKSRAKAITYLLILAASLTIVDINIVTGQAPERLQVEGLSITPNVINRSAMRPTDGLIAVLVFPKGTKTSDIANEPLVLNPGNIKSRRNEVTEKEGNVEITALFAMADLMNNVPDDHYGPLDLEVTGKLKSGRDFFGETTINIIQAEGISDYISDIYISQIRDYGDPTDSNDLTHEFYLAISADDYKSINMNVDVNSIEFLTPADKTFQIPKLPSHPSDGISTSYEYDAQRGVAIWEYRSRSIDVADLQAYGDGEYTIILHHPDGSKSQTTALFGNPETEKAIPQPTQEPVLASPVHHQTVGSPVTFTWEPCADPNINYIYIDVDELGTAGLGDKEEDFSQKETSWGPVYLPNGFWEAELWLASELLYNVNKDGIGIFRDKSSTSRYRFTVEGSPWTRYEVWGGNTWISHYGNIGDLEAYEKLGASDGPTATFSGPYEYYVIATVGEFLLDSIQGSDGSYYSSFDPKDIIHQIYDPNNLLGPPDGQCAIVGGRNRGYDYSGYLAFTNPGDWNDLTVYTSELNLNLSTSIVSINDGIGNIDSNDVHPNDTITYRISFDSNDFIQDVTSITVVDLLPDEVSFVSADSNEVSGTYDPVTHTYIWFYPVLAPQSAVETQFTVQVNPDISPGTAITNFVTINSNETPPSTASARAAIPHKPLNITKKAIDSSGREIQWINPGYSFIYQICFDNNDNSSIVTGVSLGDTLPSEVDFVDYQVSDSNFIGAYVPQNHSFIGTLDSLKPGLGICLEITVKVKQDTPLDTVITNSVTIESNETPSSTASTDTTVSHRPLNITKRAVTKRAVDGSGSEIEWIKPPESFIYKICFDNNDNSFTATNVFLRDTLPSEVDYVDYQVSDSNFIGAYVPQNHSFIGTLDSLKPGLGICLEITVKVKQDTPLTNSVTIESNETPPSTASIEINKPLNITKRAINSSGSEIESTELGGSFIYQICFDNNNRSAPVTSIFLRDTLPSEVDYVDYQVSDSNFIGDYVPQDHSFTGTLKSLKPGLVICLEITVEVKQDAPLTNSVTIESNETPSSTASTDTTVSHRPLNITKRAVDGSGSEIDWIKPGESFIYKICFDNNNRSAPVTSIFLRDTLPSEVDYVDYQVSYSNFIGAYVTQNHSFIGTLNSLKPGLAICLEITVKVKPDTPLGTIVSNTVTVKSNETPLSTASIDTTVPRLLNITKKAIDSSGNKIESIKPGDTFTYQVCFDNNNNSFKVTDVVLRDTLPSEVNFVDARVAGSDVVGDYDPNTHSYNLALKSLEPGLVICLEITAQVKQGTPLGTKITNSVAIESNETTPATTSVSVNVEVPPPLLVEDVTITPNVLRRNGTSVYITAVVQFPEGVNSSDIDPADTPGLYYQDLFITQGRQALSGSENRPKITILFSRAELMNDVHGYGEFKLRVQGKLKSGRTYYGDDIIYITRFAGD